jgi:hypothetical protein
MLIAIPIRAARKSAVRPEIRAVMRSRAVRWRLTDLFLITAGDARKAVVRNIIDPKTCIVAPIFPSENSTLASDIKKSTADGPWFKNKYKNKYTERQAMIEYAARHLTNFSI